MNKYELMGKIMAMDGKGDELKEYLLEAARLPGDHPDCISYVIGLDNNEPDAVYVTEIWSNKAAHSESLNHQAVKELISKARPIISSLSQIKELNVVGGKGV